MWWHLLLLSSGVGLFIALLWLVQKSGKTEEQRDRLLEALERAEKRAKVDSIVELMSDDELDRRLRQPRGK